MIDPPLWHASGTADLVARVAALDLTPLSPGNQTERARVEGWAHLPTSDLPRLQRL